MIKSLCILGGGNAGFISALMARAAFPNLKISLIKSNRIPAIGVGEGSNEHWLEFAKVVGITTEDVVKHADATFKHGIKFTNWRGKDDVYYHSLPEYLSAQDNYSGLPYILLDIISQNLGPENLVWSMSKQGLIADPRFYDFAQFHFNTFKLNDYLETLCLNRNIDIKIDTIQDVILDSNGSVKCLKGEIESYSSDFFIDTSGFQRIISKKLNTEWISYQKYLPINSAIAFPSEIGHEEISTFTESRARNYGWSWQSPVQGRYGNGYVFSDQFTNVDSVINEIQKDYKEKIQIARDVKFDSGRLSKVWSKNTLSTGLSGSFIEPLEASNIGTTIMQIKSWMTSIVCWTPGDQIIEKNYNKTFKEIAENTLDFVQLHYLTEREDTEFWRWCKHEMPLTEFNQKTVEYFKHNFVNYNFFHRNNYELFDELDWAQVMYGLGLFNTESLKNLYNNFPHLQQISKKQLSSVVTADQTSFYSHRQLINLIKN